MKKFAVLLVVLFSCTDEERTVKVLADQGYTNIDTTGHSRRCGEDDTYCTGFIARNPVGKQVSGVVGCGSNNGCGKGCTVRFD